MEPLTQLWGTLHMAKEQQPRNRPLLALLEQFENFCTDGLFVLTKTVQFHLCTFIYHWFRKTQQHNKSELHCFSCLVKYL